MKETSKTQRVWVCFKVNCCFLDTRQVLLRGINGLLIVLSAMELCLAISSAVLGIKALMSRQKADEEVGAPCWTLWREHKHSLTCLRVNVALRFDRCYHTFLLSAVLILYFSLHRRWATQNSTNHWWKKTAASRQPESLSDTRNSNPELLYHYCVPCKGNELTKFNL